MQHRIGASRFLVHLISRISFITSLNRLNAVFPNFFLLFTLFACLFWQGTVFAQTQQPTATITELSGTVVVTIRGQEQPGQIGAVLTETNDIRTEAQATATLALSDGSIIQLEGKTRANLALLLETPEKARKSRLKLLYGRLRAFLSPGHQKEGSSFEMETPNAQVGVKFSQPQTELEFDPQTITTIVRAYTVGMSVMNLRTKAEVQMPQGHQAIVRDEFILVTKIAEMSRILDQIDRMAQDRLVLTEPILSGETGRLPAVYDTILANGPATSQIPGSEGRTDPEKGAESTGVSVTIDVP